MNAFFFSRVSQRQRTSFLTGLIALLACGIGACLNSRQFFISYLQAYLFWLGLSLGCLCVAMIHHLTGGRWGDVTRRFLEAGYMTLPMMAVFFLPVLVGLRTLYPWAQTDAAPDVHFLGVPGFMLRAVLYFAIWIGLAVPLRKWSLQQDGAHDQAPTRQARALSAAGLAIYALSVTVAWMDWAMSLEPDGHSTLLPVMVCGGQILATIAFVILILSFFRHESLYQAVVEPGHFHQLGGLLLTFVVFWSSLCCAQFLILWSGDLPQETAWYLHRTNGQWKWIAGLIVLLNFCLPFFLLLSRGSKKNRRGLRISAAVVFVLQAINGYWLVEPAFFPAGVHLHWMDLAAPVAIGGLWIAKCAVSFKRAPLLTSNEARPSYSFAPAQ